MRTWNYSILKSKINLLIFFLSFYLQVGGNVKEEPPDKRVSI